METMVPWRSWQKGHEETPGTNLFACGQVAADHPCQETFVTQRAVRTFKVSMAFLPRFVRNLRSELTWKKIFLEQTWYGGFYWVGVGLAGQVYVSTLILWRNWDTRDDFNGFIPFHASGMAEIVFGVSLHLAVETRLTLTRRNRFESAWKAGKWQRIQETVG